MRAATLPRELDAIVACSDLQGIVPRDGVPELLGIAVAEALDELAFDRAIPPAARTGVVLAGDLYAVPEANKRGGHGAVARTRVAAIAERFAWVVGVAGNHDEVDGVERDERVILLDGDIVELDGWRIGGVGRIAGNPAKLGRRAEDDQLARIDLAADGVDLLVLHEGPCGGDDRQPGSAAIRAAIERAGVPLTICGHDHWDVALAEHPRGRILNVDARVLVMTA